MKKSYLVGLSFGLTSGIITTLGLLVGLYSSTYSRLVVIGGILSIAVADALSDAFGIHMTQESEGRSSKRKWEASTSTFVSKLIFATMFIVPVLVFELRTAVIVSIVLGLILIGLFSTYLYHGKKNRTKQVLEHLIMAIIVIVTTYFLGLWINITFNGSI